ncbi:MAG: 2-C-methyl-D-erythritol 4-phosphate cytidylyltransferase [Planctomycetota bacterium]
MSAPVALIIPAAGLGARMGGRRKTFLHLAGKPILFHTLDRFRPFARRILQTVVVLCPDDVDAARQRWGATLESAYGVTDLVPGGARRQDSVRAGLARVRPDCELVAIQDAVRPFVPPSAIAASFEAAERIGAAVVAAPMKPTVKRVTEGRVVETIDRSDLWGAQTPQVFRRPLILDAYQAAERDGLTVTDDAQVVEHLGYPVAAVPGSELNLKITTPDDLALAEALLAHHLLPE